MLAQDDWNMGAFQCIIKKGQKRLNELKNVYDVDLHGVMCQQSSQMEIREFKLKN